MPLTSGDRYAGFIIDELLGSGSTGIRYRAIQVNSQAEAHLKILSANGPVDPGRLRQFRRTNDTIARSSLPGTPLVLDFGEEGEQLWVATELIKGVSSSGLVIQRFPSGIPHKSLCLIADHVARTVESLSRQGIYHGNISPENILLADPFSKHYRVVVTDFGHRYFSATTPSSTYAAPEVLAGAAASARSDQFALAASMFHLLTAQRPFSDSSRRVTASGSVPFDVDALRASDVGGDGLAAVFARAFAVDPSARFRSCGEFVDNLVNPFADMPMPAAPAPARARTVEENQPAISVTEPGRRRTDRTVVLSAVAALTAALVATVAAVVIKPAAEQTDAPPPSAPVAAANPSAAAPPCQELDAAVAGLTLRQKLAQTLMVGVTDIDDARAVANDHEVGGIFITSWTDLSMLDSGELRELQRAPRPIPLAVSVDEEGGRVQRLKSRLGDQDSPRQLVAEGITAQQVHDIAFERGQKMREYGITIDFAPVVDVSAAADNTVIGDRSFSDDPATVTEYAGAYAQGLRDAGLLPVLKHFPGHGRASGDSHQSGVTTPPLPDLAQRDTIPYATLTTARPVGVMLGHMQIPGLTDTDPASLSGAAYSLLRDGGYGGPPFDGPTFTDDLSSMRAINLRYSVPEAVLKALRAGADTALWISTDQVPAVLDRLENAVGSGELAEDRVEDAVRQMAVTKNPSLSCTR